MSLTAAWSIIHARDPKQLRESARDAETWCEVLHKGRTRFPEIIINMTTGVDPANEHGSTGPSFPPGPEVAS